MNTLRFNKYVREYTLEELHILYNILNDAVIVVEPELFDSIKPFISTPERIDAVNHLLFEKLNEYQFLVPSDTHEEQKLIENWEKEDMMPETIKLTVNPTLQCNLRCWYCYENHNGITKMSPQTLESIKKLIGALLDKEYLKKLILDFFGGEPLLYFDSCIKPLVEFAVSAARKRGKQIGIGFTTNGVLLTDSICRELKKANVPTSFQITLDGDKERHDSIRFLRAGTGTFDTIVSNIKLAASCGFEVTVRYNYTAKNYTAYDDLLRIFENLDESVKSKLKFSFHKVWQENESGDIETKITNTKINYSNSGFKVNLSVNLGPGRCYADQSQNLVVNYNGLIYKCTARDFSPERAEGKLQQDGSIEWNSRFDKREQIKYGLPVCRSCSIYPICHNGCSQDKLEQEITDSCPLGRTDQDKEVLAKRRATQLLQYMRTY